MKNNVNRDGNIVQTHDDIKKNICLYIYIYILYIYYVCLYKCIVTKIINKLIAWYLYLPNFAHSSSSAIHIIYGADLSMPVVSDVWHLLHSVECVLGKQLRLGCLSHKRLTEAQPCDHYRAKHVATNPHVPCMCIFLVYMHIL